MPRVLHLLSQRPSLTGSGITLDAMVRHAARAGWGQRVVVGTPADDPAPQVGGLEAAHVLPLAFDNEAMPFPVPGMSDVMPYRSTRFSAMTPSQLDAYRRGWRRHIEQVVADFEPDLIHAHHIWLLGAMLKDLAEHTPVLGHCHATGLRQMVLCPHLADGVRRGCARNDSFAVLHRGHATHLRDVLGIGKHRVHVVGAGYREELFHAEGRAPAPDERLLYIGKLSAAKGLPQLLEAVDRLAERMPELELHVAGSGAGPEAEALRRRMRDMGSRVVHHGQVDQAQLASLMRSASACVLPSFYEGLPLVLVEALACGCRLVATALPGIEDELAPFIGPALELVPMPPMQTIDQPDPAGLDAFVDDLATAIAATLARDPIDDPRGEMPDALRHFTWGSVFQRVEKIWGELLS